MNQINLFIELTRLKKPIGYMLPFFEPAILDINEFDGEITPLEKVEFDETF